MYENKDSWILEVYIRDYIKKELKHPFVITDRGTKTLSFNDVRLTKKKHIFNNSGWHVSDCFKINDIIRKFESFAHTQI